MHFPLIQKELLEQSAKKKTYIIRLLFGLAFYSLFFIHWHSHTNLGLYVHGQGQFLIQKIFLYQFICIFVFVPPLVASVIASEKENGTLALLLISRLHQKNIIFGKLIGRLLPVFSLVLMSVPSLAISYSLGGVATEAIFYGLVVVFICIFQVA